MNIHLIAVGGSIMHNLAIALQNKGYKVTGSDDEIFEPAKSHLQENNLLPQQTGWFEENIHIGLDAVIIGMHAKQGNPELERARALQIPIYSFPEYVFEQIKNKRRVVIAGSHGKTTITSMILHVLRQQERKFDYLVGAAIEGFDLMVHMSEQAPVAVLEGDEYLTSALDPSPKFLHYHPHISLISGIAWDHINVFPTYKEYFHQFERFVHLHEPGSTIIYNQDDQEILKLVQQSRPDLYYVPYQQPSFTPQQNGSLVRQNKHDIFVPVFGGHNIANLEGARQVCHQLGVEDDQFMDAMKTFTGAGKRLELISEGSDCAFYRDFAHAPSKVEAVVKALKEQYPARKLIACLELHTYSSLQKHFLAHYAGKMGYADVPIVYFNSHELALKQLPMLTEEDIREGFQNDAIHVFTDKDQLAAYIREQHGKNTNFLFMSSGQFDGLDIQALANAVCIDGTNQSQ
ncbi:MAG: peptidoglycan synthetase [Bacteroidetes bacterium SW_11_45_7]|nr:MAG: peptidoglycan synthetase [Bacteroidetes bacterium SW_11_45_7]